MAIPSASNSITVRVKYANALGRLAMLTNAIAEAGGSLGSIDIVEAGPKQIIRDITIDCTDPEHERSVLDKIKALPGVSIEEVNDRTFRMHVGGKIEVRSKFRVKKRDELSMAYTPGVGRVSMAVAKAPEKAFSLTIKHNTVAIVSDGTAVLGLGDIGPYGAMPVMEGKAMLFKEFGGVNAFPICLDTKDTAEIIRTVKVIAPGFGGINLEDIAAPRCFEIEDTLANELDIPVFHDDQHGTAAVILAAIINAAKIVGKDVSRMKAVVSGAGAAGVACSKVLLDIGVGDVIIGDRAGAIYRGRDNRGNAAKDWLAEHTNREGYKGSIAGALKGADFFLGVSGPGLLKADDLKAMAKDAIVFALSNPIPEILPEEASPNVRIFATGRSDYPNQINNVLCFPGLFKGLLGCSARKVTPQMVIAAARAIAGVIHRDELHEDYIIPSVFDARVAPAVASAVAKVAEEQGLARRFPPAVRPNGL